MWHIFVAKGPGKLGKHLQESVDVSVRNSYGFVWDFLCDRLTFFVTGFPAKLRNTRPVEEDRHCPKKTKLGKNGTVGSFYPKNDG